MGSNDDYCGFGSQVMFSVQPYEFVEIIEGCWDDTACGGTVTIESPNVLYACAPYFASGTSTLGSNDDYVTWCWYQYMGEDPVFVSGNMSCI